MNRIQDRDKGQAIVEKLKNLQVPHNARDSSTSCGTACLITRSLLQELVIQSVSLLDN
jgi:hypothetical protein